MTTIVVWAALVLAVANAVAVCMLAARRLVVARAERRRVRAEARLRPLALALVAGETGALQNLDTDDARVLAALIGRYAQSLRGPSAERITRFFEQRGLIEQESKRLRSRRAWRRAAAAFTLGNLGSRRAVPVLLRALDDRARPVRVAAARSLGRLGAVEAVDPIVHAVAERRITRSVAGQALLAIGTDALSGLRRLESDPDPEARAFAVELVGLLGNASDAARLVGHLHDTSAEVRAKAARALGRLGAENAVVELRAALSDRIVFVRAAAAHALGALGDRTVVPELLEVARTDSFAAAHAAALAAARLDATAVTTAATARAGPHLAEAAGLVAAYSR